MKGTCFYVRIFYETVFVYCLTHITMTASFWKIDEHLKFFYILRSYSF